MTQAQKDRNWRRLCGGKNPPPAPKSETPIPEPTLPHPERLTDPRWQWKKWGKGGYVARLKRQGMLIEQRLQAHFHMISEQAKKRLAPELDPSRVTVATADRGFPAMKPS